MTGCSSEDKSDRSGLAKAGQRVVTALKTQSHHCIATEKEPKLILLVGEPSSHFFKFAKTESERNAQRRCM